jgi:cytochrome P450
VAPSSFLDQALGSDPELARDPVFVENLVYLFHIARCDLTGLCGWLLKMLGDHPALGRRIREERASGADGAAARFVDETLRLRQSEYLYRTTSAPIRFEGYSVPSGWLVRLCVRESHTSPQAFDRPLAFDPDRFQGGTPSSERYQPFGIYEHACLGVGITKTVGRILVECLSAGFDWEVTRDGPMELGLHHHRHWTPSGRLEMRLTPIGTSPSPSLEPSPA